MLNNTIYFLSTFLTLLSFVSAQQISGNLEGRILNPDRQALSEVNIIISGENLQGTRGTVSNSRGYFHIPDLPPGRYSLNISHVAYHDLNMVDIIIKVGKTTSTGIRRMTARTLEAPEVIVYGKRPVIDPESTTYGGSIKSEDFVLLPIDRDYTSIASLLPQANSSYYGDPVNITGATGYENKYFIDGIEVTEPLLGVGGTYLPYNFIREVEIIGGGNQAGSFGALGGKINAITHSGSNTFQGSVYGFYTSNHFSKNRREGTLDNQRGNFTNYDVGFGLGGPVIRDKLWFYVAYNPVFNVQDAEISGFGTYADRKITHAFATKLNWRAQQDLHLVLTISGDLTENDGIEVGEAGYSFESIDSRLKNSLFGGVNYSLSAIYNINKNFSLKGSIAHAGVNAFGEGATKKGREEIIFDDKENKYISGGVGGSYDSYRYRNNGRLQATLVLDPHTLTGGVEYRTNHVDNVYQGHSLIRFSDTSYYENFNGENAKIYNRIPAVFIYDNWRLLSNLRINAGIRWEGYSIVGENAKVVQTVEVPLQPRVGFVYIFDDEDQRVYGSMGRYSQEFSLATSLANHSDNGYSYEVFYDHDPRVNPAGGDTAGFTYSIRPEVKALRGQYIDAYSLGFEKVIGWNILAGIQGTYKTLGEAIEDVYVWDENRRQYGNPGSGILSDLPKAKREYTSLTLSLMRSNDPVFNFHASYVWSRSYGNYEGLFDAYNNSIFPNHNVTFNGPSHISDYDTGLLSQDRTHVFKFSGSYNFSTQFSTGVSFIAQSGTPLSAYAGGNIGYIRYLKKRGSLGRTPSVWDLNARFVYRLDYIDPYNIKIIADAFHIGSPQKTVIVGQREYGAIIDGEPRFPIANYAKALKYQPAMSMRLGMEISF